MKLLTFTRPPSRLVLTILMCCCCSVVNSQDVCPREMPSMNPSTDSDGGSGILSPLLVNAQRTRESVFSKELPYDVIRKEISQV